MHGRMVQNIKEHSLYRKDNKTNGKLLCTTWDDNRTSLVPRNSTSTALLENDYCCNSIVSVAF